MLPGTFESSLSAGPARRRGPALAACLLGLLLLPAGAAAMECGPALATADCLEAEGNGRCGLLYLQIANLSEHGAALDGLVLKGRPAAGPPSEGRAGAAAQCRAASGPLPPADPGSPAQDCIAYLLPACTYRVQALFDDGSRARAEAVEIAPLAAAGGDSGCARVTVDLGRRALDPTAERCSEAVLAQFDGEWDNPPLPAAGSGGQAMAESVTGVTYGEAGDAEP